MERFRVAIIPNSGVSIGKNFNTKEESDEWVLKMYEENRVK